MIEGGDAPAEEKLYRHTVVCYLNANTKYDICFDFISKKSSYSFAELLDYLNGKKLPASGFYSNYDNSGIGVVTYVEKTASAQTLMVYYTTMNVDNSSKVQMSAIHNGGQIQGQYVTITSIEI